MKETLWMNASEAVDFGLADKVKEDDEETEEAEKEKNKWDLLLVCNSADREHAEEPTRVAARVVMLNNQKEKNMTASTAEPDPTTEPEPTTDTDPVTEPEPTIEPEPAVQPAAIVPPLPVAPVAQAQGVMINGQLETDLTKIAAYVATLETAQNDAAEVTRKNFVEKLSDDNKIPATMVDSLTAHALSLNDEQFASFRTSYESLPESTLFQNHATTQDDKHVTPVGNTKMTAAEKKDRISILAGIVDQHRRTMTPEDVEKTNSYKELQELQSEDKE